MFFLIPRYIHNVSFPPAWSRYLGGGGTRGVSWQKEKLLKDSDWPWRNTISPLFWTSVVCKQRYWRGQPHLGVTTEAGEQCQQAVRRGKESCEGSCKKAPTDK